MPHLRPSAIIMQKNLFIFTLLLLLCGCQKIECPAFDFSHPVNKWHWFPNSEAAYDFVAADSSAIQLTQTRFQFNGFEERWCHLCLCDIYLTTEYEFIDFGIRLRSDLFISDESSDLGSLFYGVDNVGSPFRVEDETVLRVDYGDKEFDLTFHETFTIVDSTFSSLTELAVIDTSKTSVRKIWIAPNAGIVGLDLFGKVWKRH